MRKESSIMLLVVVSSWCIWGMTLSEAGQYKGINGAQFPYAFSFHSVSLAGYCDALKIFLHNFLLIPLTFSVNSDSHSS